MFHLSDYRAVGLLGCQTIGMFPLIYSHDVHDSSVDICSFFTGSMLLSYYMGNVSFYGYNSLSDYMGNRGFDR